MVGNWRIDKIREDLLDVLDDPVMLKRRVEYYHRDSPRELEVILHD